MDKHGMQETMRSECVCKKVISPQWQVFRAVMGDF